MNTLDQQLLDWPVWLTGQKTLYEYLEVKHSMMVFEEAR
jgi:hypothetical protein